MKIHEIENLLDQMKDDPRVSAVKGADMDKARSRVFAHVDSSLADAPVRNNVVFDFVASIPTTFTDMVARPTAFASLLVVMVLGGWITSVNASLSTLPGDALYPMKLASEKAQLTLASNDAQTKLHAEFAARRLDEIVTLVNSNDDHKDEYVQVAIDGFNKQIDSVNHKLEESEDAEAVAELARIIDQQTNSLEDVLEMVDTDRHSHEVIAEAVEANDEISDSVVDALVLQVVEEDLAVTKDELARQFTSKVRTISSRVDTLSARVERLLTVVEARENIEIDVEHIRAYLVTLDLSDAMNYAAMGGYERAFEITGEMERTLRSYGTELTIMEIALTAPPVVEEEVEEDVPIVEDTEESPVIDSVVDDADNIINISDPDPVIESENIPNENSESGSGGTEPPDESTNADLPAVAG